MYTHKYMYMSTYMYICSWLRLIFQTSDWLLPVSFSSLGVRSWNTNWCGSRATALWLTYASNQSIVFIQGCCSLLHLPICSIYGIFTNMCRKNHPNVGKCTIHGACGLVLKATKTISTLGFLTMHIAIIRFGSKEVFCRTTGRAEPIVELHTVDLGAPEQAPVSGLEMGPECRMICGKYKVVPRARKETYIGLYPHEL